MSRTGPAALSSDAFEPGPTSGRLLAVLSSPVRLFVIVTLSFSVLGGLLQVVGSARGPLARDLLTTVTVHVAGNLVASAVTIALVVAARRRGRQRASGRDRESRGGRSPARGRVSVGAAALGGALGGAARLPLELLAGSTVGAQDAAASMLTDGGWFLIAALLANTVAGLARNERDARAALGEALQLQTVLRTQMLAADLRTRRDVAEWLHGRLQAELLLAADEVRRAGPAGVAAAERLARLRDDELRGLARSLHPSLAEIDLAGALGELARRFTGTEGRSVRVDVDPDLQRAPLAREVSVALYRVCEEAVANAVKHGGAADVTVTLRRGPAGGVLLVVTDDGDGPGEVTPGLGLALIDTHVRTVGGSWDLRAGAGSGATLTVSVPDATSEELSA